MLREFAPPPHLRPALDAVWAYDGPAAGMAHHLVLPDGCVDLIVRWAHPDEGAHARVWPVLLIAGPTATSNLIQVAAGVRFLGARFAPGAARAVLGVEPAALIGAVTEAGIAGVQPGLAALAGRLADAAGRGIFRRGGFEAEIAASIAAAGPRGVPPRRVREAVALLHTASDPDLRIAAVARALGVAERTLHRDLVAWTGLPPKALARVFRFRSALVLLRRAGAAAPLAAVAIEAGYADQAHMSREFRAIGGFVPSRAR